MTRESPVSQQGVYPKRTQAAIALVLLLVLVWVRAMLVSVPERGADVTAVEKRFAALHEALPPRGVIGYLSDSDFFGDYYLTEYALAPVVVYQHPTAFPASGSRPSMVVGNFNSPVSIPEALARNKLILKRDFSDGVLLLEPETR